MTKQVINVGTSVNDRTGDSIRSAFQKVNANFTELYNSGGVGLGAFEFNGSIMTTTDSSAIVIDQATTITSNLSVGGDILPQTALGGDLGSSTLPWRSLYVSQSTIYLGGVPLTLDASGNLTVNGSQVGGGVTSYADLTGKPTIPTLVSQLSNDSGFLTSVGNISNIQSEGDINIDINLADSTLRRWRFGEDGDLTFPDGTNQATAYPGIFTGYDNEVHVSGLDGNDTTGNGDLLKPVASITKALTLVTGERRTVIVHPGTYTENPTITYQYTVLTGPGLLGGNIVISGTVTATTGCTITGLKMTNLTSTVASGGGNLNILNCEISGTLTKSGSGDYTLVRLTDFAAATITGSGLVDIYGGNTNFVTVNNAAANVLIKNGTTVAPVLTAGSLSLVQTVVIAAVTNAVTSAAGTVVTLANSQILTSALNNVAPVVLNGFYSIFNCVFDKPGSTLVALSATGGSTSSVDYFQFINADRLILASGGQITFPDATVQSTAWTGSVSSLVNGGSTLSLGTDGSLTIPGDIKSNSNINIDINLSDSTLRRWQFGEDGNLVVPGDINLSGGTISQYSQNGLTGLKLVANADQGQNVTIMGTGNNTFPILNYVGTTLSGITIGTPEGDWNFMNGNLTIPGDIRSDSNINIDINLADSTLRRWSFGEDGILTLPSTGKINNGNYEWQFGTDGGLTLPGYITSRTGLPLNISPSAGSNGSFSNSTGSIGLFVNDTAPFITNGNNSWTFGTNGSLTFPDNTVQTTAYTGTVTVAASTLTGTVLASGVVSSSLTSVGTLRTLAVTGGATAESFDTDQITVVGNRISTTVTNANLELECNGSGGVVINTVADATTSSTVKSVGYLGLPQSATATTATLAIGDAGKHIYITTTGQTITIPAASSVAYPIGTTLTFIAGPSATTATIAITTDTLRLAGGTSTGSRTLAANGMATAVKVSGTSSAGVWYINGTGLT